MTWLLLLRMQKRIRCREERSRRRVTLFWAATFLGLILENKYICKKNKNKRDSLLLLLLLQEESRERQGEEAFACVVARLFTPKQETLFFGLSTKKHASTSLVWYEKGGITKHLSPHPLLLRCCCLLLLCCMARISKYSRGISCVICRDFSPPTSETKSLSSFAPPPSYVAQSCCCCLLLMMSMPALRNHSFLLVAPLLVLFHAILSKQKSQLSFCRCSVAAVVCL